MITLPSDVELNWLLRESQVAGGATNHPCATMKTYTRMQVKILDHKKVLETMRWPAETRGSAVVRVGENAFLLDVEGGKASATEASGDAGFVCPDPVWAAVVCGELNARVAVRMGLAQAEPRAIKLLEALAIGPKPFCHEAF